MRKEMEIAVYKMLCKRCGICVELCPQGVFNTDDMGLPYVARMDACTECFICELHCPEYAIELAVPER
ncbi:ferredoxin family protein [Thermodesulfobacteriota bacterium]